MKKFLSLFTALLLIPTLAFATVSNTTCYGTDGALMLLGGEANNSTTIIDSSALANTMTCNGSDKASTTQAKFSSSSIFCPGGTSSGQFVGAPDNAAFNLAGARFTLELWAYFTSIVGERGLFSMSNTSTGQDVSNVFDLRVKGSNSNNLEFFVISGGSTLVSMDGAHGMSTGVWYHIALIRGWNGNVNDFAITVNGTAIATATAAITIPDFTSVIRVGDGSFAGNRPHDGHISNVRLTPGVAIWTAGFSSPVAAYTPCAGAASKNLTLLGVG